MYFDKPEWKEKAVGIVNILGMAIVNHPTSFGAWLGLLQEIIVGTSEISLVKPDPESLHIKVLEAYIPHKILMSTGVESSSFPILRGKRPTVRENLYLCRNYTCLKPVNTVNQLLALIRPK